MAYTPIVPGDLAPGTDGNASGYSTLVDNHDEVYEQYAPPVAAANTAIQTTSATFVDVAEVKVPQNEDEEGIRIAIRWYVTGGNTATCECDLTDGSGTDTASTTTTSGAESDGTISITPSNSAGGATPRTLTIKLKTTGGTAYIEAVCVYTVPAAPGSGTLTSGFERHHSGWYTSGQPVPSEVCSRLMDGPPLVASDRPACLVAILGDISAGSSRARYTTSTSGVVAVFKVPPGAGHRSYRVAFKVARDGGVSSHSATVHWGAQSWTTTSTGWTQNTVSLGGFMASAPVGAVTLAVTGGSGNVYLHSLQIIREPAS